MNDPNWRLPEVPAFPIESSDIQHGGELPGWARSGIMGAGGEDRSPALSWSGAPEGTRSFVLTCYDPDAPTGSGFWHWVVLDLPAATSSLATDAGNPESGLLPEGARSWRNEVGLERFLGAAPPSGHGPHRYFFTLTALDVDRLEVDEGASPAVVGFSMLGHVLGRAQIMATTETP
jgi:Raf kinase inhibitor-like YbhB/YbcL family protein